MDTQKLMDTQNWILIASALIITIGWFVTGHLDRKNAIFLKQLDFHGEALRSFVSVWAIISRNSAPFTQPGFDEKLQYSSLLFNLYCNTQEKVKMQKFIDAINMKNISEANEALGPLVEMIPKSIRADLNII